MHSFFRCISAWQRSRDIVRTETVQTIKSIQVFGTRRKEHENKVRLTGEDIRNGRLDAARERMGKEDGGLARHSVDCGSGIDGGEARVVACEYGLRQRKAREGIESLRERSNEKVILNNYEPLTT